MQQGSQNMWVFLLSTSRQPRGGLILLRSQVLRGSWKQWSRRGTFFHPCPSVLPINVIYQVIPRNVLENAKGFAIFTVFKAGFLFSARAGSGLVVAKLPDGCRPLRCPRQSFIERLLRVPSVVGSKCHRDCGARCGYSSGRGDD